MRKRTKHSARRALRILLVVDSLDPGGAERHVVELASSLKTRGHDVTVAASTDGALASRLEEAGVEFRPLVGRLVKRRCSLRFAARLRRLVHSGRFDLVHAHVYASAAAAALAAVGAGVPLVVTEHTEAPWRGRGARLLSRWVYRRCAHVVAVSSSILRLLEEEYGVPFPRATFVPPGLAPVELVACPRAVAFPPAWTRVPVVGRVARLAPEKGIDVFLRAAARVLELVPDACFAIVGEGSARAELEVLAEELGIDERVRFLGYRPDARLLMPLLDVLAVSSLSDGTPLVVLEAMEAGVPVVATAVGGIVDEIRHGREGLLVPAGDERALALAIVALVEDRARAGRLAEAARRRVADFSHDRMVERLEEIYRRVVVSGAPFAESAPAARPAPTARSAAG